MDAVSRSFSVGAAGDRSLLAGLSGGVRADELDTIFDWLLATRDVLLAAGLEGADLMAVSVSGALAADVAGVWPGLVRKLVLLAPFRLFTPADPPVDIWSQRPGHLSGLLCAGRETYRSFIEQPDDADPLEWKVEQMRALEASARYLFPTGNTGLAQRLHRIRCPVLLLRGADDRVMPASYLDRFAASIAGHTAVKEIRGAGHLAELDQPEEVARTVLDFLES